MNASMAEMIRARLRANRVEIEKSLSAAQAGNPYAAEPDDRRRKTRLQTKNNLTPQQAAAVDSTIEAAAAATPRREAEGFARDEPAAGRPRFSGGAEKVWGDRDFVSVSFLSKGAHIARAVGRVAYRNSRPQGTGFLIGEGLFITNHHVVPNAELSRNLMLEFDYELDLTGNRKPTTAFAIDASIFVTDSDEQTGLDYSVFAVGERLSGVNAIETFGWSGLSDAGDKHMLGEFANIVQHPDGRHKEVVLRENRLVGRFDNALHYVADTEPGSSGSPVFNSEWRPIALHHWGAPWREVFGDDGQPANTEVNEGIRISSIVRHLRAQLRDLPPHARDRIARALDKGEAAEEPGDRFEPAEKACDCEEPSAGPRVDETGRVTWSIPLEVSLQIPMLARRNDPPPPPGSAAAVVGNLPPAGPTSEGACEQYRDRGGYKRGFIEGHDVPLPKLGASLLVSAARNKKAEAGDDPFELKYHHFSVVMNGARRLAFFTACNIDGASAKSVDRKTKQVTPLRPDSPGLERVSAEAAEAETWSGDCRIDPREYAGADFYEGQKVPGFPKPNDKDRIARMFQRGHLVRRLDPCWGDDEIARMAEEDTFHWTNCSPQVGFFNQGTADPKTPGTGGGALWRAVENYVLRNAVAMKQRVTSFSGPIFEDDDRPFRGVKVPERFFKVTVWAEPGGLRSLAMIADQSRVFKEWPEALFEGAGESLGEEEAFMDEAELDKVEDFLSTIREIEKLTELDFGAVVRDADVRAGAGEEKIDDFSKLTLKPRKARKPKEK